jgi:predicted short-subunit dehydrogenase-like oxidoreductase (DUF2520 family)
MDLLVHVIGAGRAGIGVARLLAKASVPIGQVVTRAPAAAYAAVQRIGDGTPGIDATTTLTEGSITLLAVPDRAVAKVAASLADGPLANGAVALHLSGALPGAALAPLRRRGVAVGSMHPLASFADRDRPPESLEGITFDLDGDLAARAAARDLVRRLGARAIEIGEGGKTLFHAAASLVSNGLVALFDVAQQIAERGGAPPMGGRIALAELARSTLENIAHLGAPHALTGPIERGEAETVASHLAALRSSAPDLLADYRTFARATLASALRKGSLDDAQADALARLLEQP